MISMHYPGNENTQSCEVEAALLMKYQNLVTKLKGNVQQLEGEISKQILLLRLTDNLEQFSLRIITRYLKAHFFQV